MPYKEPSDSVGDFAANMRWLNENWTDYKDEWVALSNGSFVASAKSRIDLQSVINLHENKRNIMCVQVGHDYVMSGA